jgi:hypothetical protein
LALRPHPSKHVCETASSHPLVASAKKTFGAATGVSDPRRQKIRIKNNGTGGQAATVAGYDSPGFHTWPSGHIPPNTYAKPLLRIRSSPLQKTRSVPRPGSATHGDKEKMKKKPWRAGHIQRGDKTPKNVLKNIYSAL